MRGTVASVRPVKMAPMLLLNWPWKSSKANGDRATRRGLQQHNRELCLSPNEEAVHHPTTAIGPLDNGKTMRTKV